MDERAQFDWDAEIKEKVERHCEAAGHPAGPALIRVYDFVAVEPCKRLKFTGRQCDCGLRLYIEGQVEVKDIIKPRIVARTGVAATGS